jgi:hypothetical protein
MLLIVPRAQIYKLLTGRVDVWLMLHELSIILEWD